MIYVSRMDKILNFRDWIRLIVLCATGQTDMLPLNVFGMAIGRGSEALAMSTILNIPYWSIPVCLYLTECLSRRSTFACLLYIIIQWRLEDKLVAGIITLMALSIRRNLASVAFVCGALSCVLVKLVSQYKRQPALSFIDILTRFTLGFSFSTLLACSQLRISLMPYLCKSSFVIYCYWLCCLMSMFYLTLLIPKKFQSSRFRLYLSRKLYHFIAFAMFVPCYLYDPEVASGSMACALSMLIGVEVCRLASDFRSDKEAIRLTKYLSRFLTVEEGINCSKMRPITSHISLLAGCFIPVYFATDPWAGVSGILSVGVGDSMVFGILLNAFVGLLIWNHVWKIKNISQQWQNCGRNDWRMVGNVFGTPHDPPSSLASHIFASGWHCGCCGSIEHFQIQRQHIDAFDQFLLNKLNVANEKRGIDDAIKLVFGAKIN